MKIRPGVVGLALLGLTLATGSAWAEGNSIRGTVKDKGGKPVAGAVIRAERTDAKGPAFTAKTDDKGHYALSHLPLGTYKVVALLNKSPKSAATIKTSAAGWVKVDFDLKDLFAGKNKGQNAMERTEGQDLQRMQETQGFKVNTIPPNVHP